MPLPFILAGAAVIAAGVGVKKGLDAKEKFNEAKEINDSAERRVERAKRTIERARTRTNTAIENLGGYKVELLNTSVKGFLDTMEQIKNIEFTTDQQLDRFIHNKEELQELRDIQVMATGIAQGLGTGLASGALTAFGAYSAAGALATASTGTAIAGLSGAAATNATLAFFGGGSLAAGGLGMAGGAAVLGGIVAGPALAVLGLVANAKAETALEDAKSNRAESRAFAAEMDRAASMCNGISDQADMVRGFLTQLNGALVPLVEEMKDIILRSGNDYKQYNSNEKGIIAQAVTVVKTVKAVLETRLLTDDGNIDVKSVETIQKLQAGNI